jgi:nucleoside-diphosphate-sugar epimerase
MNPKPRKIVFGCGYVGHRVAQLWKSVGAQVCVVTRSTERAKSFEADGFETWISDVTDPKTLVGLPEAETVLFSVGYDRKQSQSIVEVYRDGVINTLNALQPSTKRIIYVSSTGVYGDAAGEWVDEQAPAAPSREGGRASLSAEQTLFAHALGSRGIVLRLAGIYGPGRVPNRNDLLAGRPIESNPDGWLNLIHVDDAARVILTAEKLASPPIIYNVADGNPAPRRAYYEELARLIDAPQPKFNSPGETTSERVRGTTDKRVSNARMLADLQVQLQYPSFREGLAAIVHRS